MIVQTTDERREISPNVRPPSAVRRPRPAVYRPYTTTAGTSAAFTATLLPIERLFFFSIQPPNLNASARKTKDGPHSFGLGVEVWMAQ